MSFDEMAAKAFKISSFTRVGHLLHINLKDHMLESKHEVGKALLDAVPTALVVVNKLNTIDNTYRNFENEIIAKREGCEKTDDELMIVEVNENKCRYRMDFSKVYWNSRLSTEHERIIAKLNKGHDIVFDLFAGVGPFSVPAAKAKCKAHCNDLNPDSYHWLCHNMKYNKVIREFYETSNIDAKDYILNELKPKLYDEYQKIVDQELATLPKVHIIMNLPALAPTFLPYFRGLFKEDTTEERFIKLYKELTLEHIVYCYCFLKGVFDDPKAEVRKMIEENFGKELTEEQVIEIFKVRNVAPYKDMYRVEIRLDDSILFDQKSVISIMKGANNKVCTNGSTKKVTIRTPDGRKRGYDDSLNSSDDDETEDDNRKKTKYTDYCTII